MDGTNAATVAKVSRRARFTRVPRGLHGTRAAQGRWATVHLLGARWT